MSYTKAKLGCRKLIACYKAFLLFGEIENHSSRFHCRVAVCLCTVPAVIRRFSNTYAPISFFLMTRQNETQVSPIRLNLKPNHPHGIYFNVFYK